MDEAERLERMAKQLAVLSVELKAMGYANEGWQLMHMAEELLKLSMDLVIQQEHAALVEVVAEAGEAG